MRSTSHRKGSKKYRNGRNRYEKGQHLYRNSPTQNKLVKGYCGSDTNNPELLKSTLSDIWPHER